MPALDYRGRLIEVGDRVMVLSGPSSPSTWPGWFCKIISVDDEAALPDGYAIVVRPECMSWAVNMDDSSVLDSDQIMYVQELEITPSCLLAKKARDAVAAARGTGSSGTGPIADGAA